MVKDTFFGKKRTLPFGGRLCSIDPPWVIGVLNVTPDSFYQDSRIMNRDLLLERAGEMLEEGASALDIGGYSSRPGADHISEEAERERVIPAIEILRGAYPDAILSVDTFRASIAEEAVQHGADMVNDVSGGVLDPTMMDRTAELGVPYVLMHMPGTPQDMQQRTGYDNVTDEVLYFLSERCRKAREKGVNDLIIDPGFGFGKSLEQNYRLLKELESFKELGLPLLVGLSRKSMVWRKLELNPEEALNGTTAIHSLALQRGADILRVHDVREAVEAVKILKFDRNAGHFE
ncbi:MAG: dihydropteroate synthase [Flavobacteriales bacterium]